MSMRYITIAKLFAVVIVLSFMAGILSSCSDTDAQDVDPTITIDPVRDLTMKCKRLQTLPRKRNDVHAPGFYFCWNDEVECYVSNQRGLSCVGK